MTRGRKPLPEGERMVVLAVRVPQAIAADLARWAKDDGVSRSDKVRLCLSSFLPRPPRS